MLNALKARYRASVCLVPTQWETYEVIRDFTRMVYRLVLPGTIGAGYVDCPCPGLRSLASNCPYHGRRAREVIHG